ncbi:hypothetical protein EX30DRAFT_397825 [Ascodesmis nigricans]|uniref:Uncharacterized protein n=1 Tax=Ascodesmis nigricans TaxID=341454 RepID=A0A4S2MMM8_9PEZI|nr:hypothetical protein EX30DRAFT_397825 [Ascodesmis nigricans]
MAAPKPRLYLPSGTPESTNPATNNHTTNPETTKLISPVPTAAFQQAPPTHSVTVKFPSLSATTNLTPQATQTARLYPAFASEIIHIPPPPLLLPPVSGPLPRLEEKLRKIVGKLDGRKRRKELRENPPMEDWWVAYVVTKERKRRKKLEKMRELEKKRKEEEEREKRERETEMDMVECDAGEFDILDVPIEVTNSTEKITGMIESSVDSKITVPPLPLPLERKMNGPIDVTSKRQPAISTTPMAINKHSYPSINHPYINNPSNLTHDPSFINLPFRTMSTPVNPHVKRYLDNLPTQQYRPCYPVGGTDCDPPPQRTYARGQLSPNLVEQWQRLPQYWQIPAKPRTASPGNQQLYYRIDTPPCEDHPPPRSVPGMGASVQGTPSWEMFDGGWCLWNPNRNTAMDLAGLSYQQDNQYFGAVPATQVGGHQYDTETVAKHGNRVHHQHHDPSKGGVNPAPADRSTPAHTPPFHLHDDFSFTEFLQLDDMVDSFDIPNHRQIQLRQTPEQNMSNMTTDPVTVSAPTSMKDSLPSSSPSEYYDAIENTPNSTPPPSATPPGAEPTSSPTSTSSSSLTDSFYAPLARLPLIPPSSPAVLQPSTSTLQPSSSPPFLPSPTPPPQTSAPQLLHHPSPIQTATEGTRDPIYNTFLLPPPRSSDTFHTPTRTSVANLFLTFPSTTASNISDPVKEPDETDPPCVATILYFPCGHEETLWFYQCPRQWWLGLPHDARRNGSVLKSEGWVDVDSAGEGEGEGDGENGEKKQRVDICCDPTLEHWVVNYRGFCAVCCPDEREVLLVHAREWGLEEIVGEQVQTGEIMGDGDLTIGEWSSEEMQLEMEEMQDEEMWQRLCENIEEYHAEMMGDGQNT